MEQLPRSAHSAQMLTPAESKTRHRSSADWRKLYPTQRAPGPLEDPNGYLDTVLPERSSMPTVFVVGAGALGSRYLQGLKRCRLQLSVIAVDPSAPARNAAIERWAEVSDGCALVTLDMRESLKAGLDLAAGTIDLVVVATSSSPRTRIVQEITAESVATAWILEKVLAQNSRDVRKIEECLTYCSQAYVNTPYRVMDSYKSMFRQLVPPLSVLVEGGSWGPGSNAIHHIDAVAWATQSSVSDISVEIGPSGWYQTKRAGYKDFFGSVEVSYQDGSRLTLVSHNQPFSFITRVTDSVGNTIILDELNRMAIGPDGIASAFHVELQSEMTPRIVTSILTENRCDLPSLHDSAEMHSMLLDAIANHCQPTAGGTIVPIT